MKQSGICAEGWGRVVGGMGFWVYLCYSKKGKVTVSSFEQEGILMVLVGLLGIQNSKCLFGCIGYSIYD